MDSNCLHHRSVMAHGLARLDTGRFLAVFAALATVFAASSQAQVNEETWYGVVNTTQVAVHAGRAPEYDQLTKLKQGDLVEVRHVNTFGWASIAPTPGLSAFVRQQEVTQPDAQGLVRAIGRVPVFYPISDDPVQCFRKYRVDPDTAMTVLDTIDTGDRGIFYRVNMPSQMDVYAIAEFFRPATQVEIDAWLVNQAEPAPVEEPAENNPPVNPPTADPADNDEQSPSPADDSQNANGVDDDEPLTIDAIPIEPPRIEPPTEDDVEAEGDPDQSPATDDHALPTDEADEATEAPAVIPAAILTAPRGPSLEDLEKMYVWLRQTPIAEAEIAPLLKAFEDFVAQPSTHPAKARIANFRIEQLKIRRDHQTAIAKLDAATQAASAPAVQSVNGDRLVDANGNPIYTASGILHPSIVFDGRRLPLLYRIQDPLTGRTIVYLDPGADARRLSVERLLGRQVGIVGERSATSRWNIELVEDWTIDDLGTAHTQVLDP